MSTTRTFQDMLNQYLPNELLVEEFVKRDWLLNNVERDDTWKGGELIVPFNGALASTLSFGALASSSDIAEEKHIRGSVSTQPEVWGSMIFNHRDLMEHGQVSEQNLLKILPNAIERFIDFGRSSISTHLLIGPHLAKATGDGDASGNIVVDRPDRLQIGQKVQIVDDDTAVTSGYVKTIDMNTKSIKLVTARGGSTGVDISNFTAAQNAKLFHEGLDLTSYPTVSNGMTSLKNSLLSSANGGSSSLYGQTKTAYPYLQAINVDGSSVTAANILEKIFDAFVTIRQLGKGQPVKVVMSYKNMGSVMKVIEGSKGAYNVVPNSQKAEVYGWSEIMVGSVTKAPISLIAVQEMDDDVIFFLDMRAMKFYSNGFIKKRQAPDGKEYFEVRNTTGFQYIVDLCLFGDLILERPSYCGALYSISY